jgi:hypothetical protein
MKISNRLIMPQQKNRLSKYVPWAGFVLFSASLVGIALFRPEPWGDEAHYVGTVRQMGGNLSWHTFVHYPEANGPLSFFLYAIWGKLFGFELFSLRVLSIIMAGAGIAALYSLFKKHCIHWYFAFAVVASVYITPYIYGLSVFVFPDALALCCIIYAVLGFVNRNKILFTLSAAAMLITKQYSIFVLCALVGTALVNIVFFKWKEYVAFVILSIIACLPLFILIVTWKGIAPPEGIKAWDAATDIGFHASYLNAYLAMIVVYAAPANLIALRRIRLRLWIIPIGMSALGWYVLFPIQPSRVTVTQTAFTTIGFCHRFLNRVVNNETIVHGIFGVLFCIGLHLFVNVCKDLIQRLKRPEKNTFLLIYDMIIVAYFCILPFSFHVWEKYLMFVLPFWAIRQMLFEEKFIRKTAHLNVSSLKTDRDMKWK